jgi:hypothetical protein
MKPKKQGSLMTRGAMHSDSEARLLKLYEISKRASYA